MNPKPALALALALLAPCALLAAAAPAAGVARARLSPPVISERFTPLPCAGAPSARTTVEQEGCAEGQILATDKKIDILNATIFGKLVGDAAKRHFIAGNTAWLGFRDKYCLSVSDVFSGGTQAPVLDAQCEAGLGSQHVKDLEAFVRDLAGD
jgi:uncharacterized protein YecT (DUF1311 family)